ncbi:hypothetical protein [Thiobaca trueperi]|uniref:hypothetical protein n=1 Tax=Thiobaca trueperi TaxID=127458 RepID=UPI001404D832|nr:hypothetical protein [Thiobaca trueperi]
MVAASSPRGETAVGSWQLAVGSWQLAVGSWQLAVKYGVHPFHPVKLNAGAPPKNSLFDRINRIFNTLVF